MDEMLQNVMWKTVDLKLKKISQMKKVSRCQSVNIICFNVQIK